MHWSRGVRAGLLVCALAGAQACHMSGAQARDMFGGTKAEAEQAVQSYLAMWSSDGHFDAASVARFYAPRVVYYGKTFSRAQVLADKLRYIRAWPVRHYTEVPGSLTAHCDATRTICKVGIIMRWHRVSAAHAVSTGRARLEFDFVPVDGGRKIAREAASILQDRG